MKEHQLHQQEPAFDSQEPRACTVAFQDPCWQHNGSLLASQQKEQEQQLSQGAYAQRVLKSFSFATDLLAEWLAAFIASSVEKP